MSRSDDRRENVLPVTAEVGSEGGSYADPTTQVATFSGVDDPGTPSYDGGQGRVTRETLEWAGLEGDETASNILRYPTETPPSERMAARRVSGHQWRKGLAGVAAGTAALIGVSRMRKRA